MKIRNILLPSLLIMGLGLIMTESLSAQIFINLHDFGSNPSDGIAPVAVIMESNVLYGTTYFDGDFDFGTVFKINSDGTGYTNLHHFSALAAGTNTDGANPGGGYALNGTLALGGGTLYGTTFGGGRSGRGTVFKVNVDGTGFANLHNFMGSEGSIPNAGVILSGSTLYGVTTAGGLGDLSTVFKLNTNGTRFVVLHEFTAISGSSFTNGDGGQPVGGLLVSGNTLYGTAQVGGLSGNGALFAINTDGTGSTNLHNFGSESAEDANPSGALILSGSTLYGTSVSTGGTLFAINTNGLGFTNLYHFKAAPGSPATNATGFYPFGGLILSGNTLYDTATAGGNFGNGTIFAVNTDGSGFVNLYDFSAVFGPPNSLTNGDGISPSGGLALSGNTLYGKYRRAIRPRHGVQPDAVIIGTATHHQAGCKKCDSKLACKRARIYFAIYD